MMDEFEEFDYLPALAVATSCIYEEKEFVHLFIIIAKSIHRIIITRINQQFWTLRSFTSSSEPI